MDVFLIYKELNCENKYYEILKRFNNDLNLIKKFLLLFLEDDSYQNLCNSYKNNDNINLFNYAHTLKGISLNLGFTNLINSCDKLCVYLKKNTSNKVIEKLIKQVTKNYFQIINAINKSKEYISI